MTKRHPTHTAIAWFLRFRAQPDADRRTFFNWLRRDPKAIAEVEAVETIWRDLEGLKGDLDINRELSVPLPDCARMRPSMLIGAIAVVGLSLGAFGFALFTPKTQVYVAQQEQREIVLEEGSRLMLEPGAQAEVRMTADKRSVRLRAGEAAFDVAPSTARPFLVATEVALLRVVGTKFAVRLHGAELRLDVYEGRVRVEGERPIHVSAGEAIAISAKTGIRRLPIVARAPQANELLQFSATPLGEAIAALNKASATKLTLADPTLSAVPVSGVFAADNAETFAGALEALGLVRVERSGPTLILHPPGPLP